MINTHQSVVCIYCGVNSGNVATLRRHYSMNHRSKLKKCKQCPFTTSSLTELTHHVNRQHHGRQPLSCPYCDYVSFAKLCIRQHLLAVHIKQDLYGCPLCPAKFQRKHQVKAHLRKEHLIEMTPEMSVQIEKEYQTAFYAILEQHKLLDGTFEAQVKT